MNTPAKLGSLLAAATSAFVAFTRACGAEPRAILQHHLEAAGIADPLHRRRRDRQHVGVLDHRQPLAQIRQHRVRRDPRDVVVVERRQAGEDRPGIGRDRERRRVQAGERRDVLDAGRFQDDVDRLLHHLLGPPQAGARRKLQDGDEVSLVLLGNEAGRRAGEFEAGGADQGDVDHHDDRQAAHQAPGQRAIGVRQSARTRD